MKVLYRFSSSLSSPINLFQLTPILLHLSIYNFSGTFNNIKWENAHWLIVGGNETWEVASF